MRHPHLGNQVVCSHFGSKDRQPSSEPADWYPRLQAYNVRCILNTVKYILNTVKYILGTETFIIINSDSRLKSWLVVCWSDALREKYILYGMPPLPRIVAINDSFHDQMLVLSIEGRNTHKKLVR